MTQAHSSNAIATFPMTFAFQYWFPDAGNSVTPGKGDPLNGTR